MSKAEKTRTFIIESVAPIFNTKGFAGTSLNDMTAATGLTKGSIYGNFANKDEVALAVFDYNLQKLQAAVGINVAKAKSAKQKLIAYADSYEKLLFPPFTAGGCPVLNTAVEADDTHPELRKKAIAAVISWKNNIIDLVNKGKENGEFSTSTNAEQFALTMIAMIEGAVMITKLTDNSNVISTVLNSTRKMIQDL